MYIGDGKIAFLSEGTNGPHFEIREKGVGPTTHMSTFVQLVNAFMAIQSFFFKEISSAWPVMVSTNTSIKLYMCSKWSESSKSIRKRSKLCVFLISALRSWNRRIGLFGKRILCPIVELSSDRKCLTISSTFRFSVFVWDRPKVIRLICSSVC